MEKVYYSVDKSAWYCNAKAITSGFARIGFPTHDFRTKRDFFERVVL